MALSQAQDLLKNQNLFAFIIQQKTMPPAYNKQTDLRSMSSYGRFILGYFKAFIKYFIKKSSFYYDNYFF